MLDYEFSLLVKLYLFGKRLQAIAKKHNSDLMSQCVILRLVSHASVSVTEIAEIFSIKVSAATSKIAEMEKAGLLVRSETQDKRSHTVGITHLGVSQLHTLTQSMSGGSADHTLGLSKAEAQSMEYLLHRIRLEPVI